MWDTHTIEGRQCTAGSQSHEVCCAGGVQPPMVVLSRSLAATVELTMLTCDFIRLQSDTEIGATEVSWMLLARSSLAGENGYVQCMLRSHFDQGAASLARPRPA